LVSTARCSFQAVTSALQLTSNGATIPEVGCHPACKASARASRRTALPTITAMTPTHAISIEIDATGIRALGLSTVSSCRTVKATSLVTDRSQVRQSYLSEWASPFHQPYNALVAQYEHALVAMGHAANSAHQMAVGEVYQVFRTQVAVLAYSDVFLFFSLVAFCTVPFMYV